MCYYTMVLLSLIFILLVFIVCIYTRISHNSFFYALIFLFYSNFFFMMSSIFLRFFVLFLSLSTTSSYNFLDTGSNSYWVIVQYELYKVAQYTRIKYSKSKRLILFWKKRLRKINMKVQKAIDK